MISRWELLKGVAERYGGRQSMFEAGKHAVDAMRENMHLTPLDIEDNPERKRLRLAREGSEGESSTMVAERINGTVDFQDVYVLDLLAKHAAAVCRICRNGIPLGTGFLVASNIIITNNHVIGSPQETGNLTAEFDYEQTPPPGLNLKQRTTFKLDASQFFLTSTVKKVDNDPHSGLDFTLVAVATQSIEGRPITNYTPIALDGNSGKIIKGEPCIIIQHPNGATKKIVLKNNAFFSETDSRMVYETDTLPGSSGSMVVALGTCEVIALHHAGLPRTDEQKRILTKFNTIAGPNTPEAEIDWLGNEGIKVSRIIEALTEANLPTAMEPLRQQLLRKTKMVKSELDAAMSGATNAPIGSKATAPIAQATKNEQIHNSNITTKTPTMRLNLLLTALNNAGTITTLNKVLNNRYRGDYDFRLSMPGSAIENNSELFTLSVPGNLDPSQEVNELLNLPGIQNAEADFPLALNADTSMLTPWNSDGTNESILEIWDDGIGKQNEEDFLKTYQGKSKYVKEDDKPEEYRKWNHAATRYEEAMIAGLLPDPKAAGITVVHFDTGYSDFAKVRGGYNFDNDYDFLDEDNQPTDARDRVVQGVLRQPGHGTRTSSLLIGNVLPQLDDDGNFGLLNPYRFQLTPYRISASVILIDRQQQLANALDRAIVEGFDVATMSMGLPPTIATAKMAKTAYDKALIWCCAAGNEVQFVIAPAVYPGTIAVAASNPLDRDWKASSRGDTVDITAPGQDVYVPILYRDTTGKVKEGYAYGDGTSYATPHVAAAATYWLAKHKEELNARGYHGWKRVEAFRKALKEAGNEGKLPQSGFGAGILDFTKLMQQELHEITDADYAYNSWNENAFFAQLQGIGEMFKTYWNWALGRTRREEAFGSGLSSQSVQLESALFGGPLQTTFEAMGASTGDTMLTRLNTMANILETATKQ